MGANKKLKQVSLSAEGTAVKPEFDLTPFNPVKYHKWKQDNYHKNHVGYYTDVVPNFRVYYTELELLTEYHKQKRWCQDPSDEESYKNFAFGFKYELYF